MQFSPRTIQVLKNFTQVNPSIYFKAGNKIRTISQSGSILAELSTEYEIEKSFAISDLSRFLSALSLYKEPMLKVSNEYVVISEGNDRINYILAEPSLLVTPPDKNLKAVDPIAMFELEEEVLGRTMKAMSIIEATEIAVCGDGRYMTLEGINTKNPTCSTHSVRVGTTDKTFKFIFSVDNMKILPGKYEVSLTGAGYGHFKGEDVQYWIAIEQHSEFER